MAKRFLTGRGLARLDGCSPTTVITAKLAGHIVANGHGRFDVEHPKNAAWLRRVKQSKKREATTAEMRLDAVVAKVERLEFDCALARVFYMPRSAVEAWMSAYADLLTTALLAFPKPHLVPLLWSGSDAEREKFGWMVHDAMTVHVGQMGNLHHAIRRALDDAAAAYRDYRMEVPRGIHLD